jgi:hypothetical protein
MYLDPNVAAALLSSAVLLEDGVDPLSLLRGELIQALVVRIVHIVVNAIQTGLVRTCVGLGRAAVSWGALCWSVGDVVASACARFALEDVEEAEPMATLMNSGHAEIVVLDLLYRQLMGGNTCERIKTTYANAWHGGGKVDTAIEDLILGRGSFLGEIAKSQKAATEIRQEVEVEGVVGALMQLRLHFQLSLGHLAGSSPFIIDGKISVDEIELESRRSIGGVHNINLSKVLVTRCTCRDD